jgi:hypothetical protein
MALYRLVWAFGCQRLGTVLTRCGLPLPASVLAADKHRRCLTAQVYLPPLVCGRGLWPLGSTTAARAAALPQS